MAGVGSIIAAKYRLDEELGRGGMGAVYRAFHLKVHKVFALKMLLGEVAKHRSIASRFLLEAQAAGRIGHPGILEVYDVGEDADGTPFIVMELLKGEALSGVVRRTRLDVEAACWVAMEVLDVLSAAHGAGIVHRDVKPQNVFVTVKAEGERGIKLLDFGIAKFSGGAGIDGSALTRSGEIIGSPLYMAPEQAKGEPDLDERADVWSVGAMLFEMLTGNCAHAANTPVAVLAKILTEPAPAPSTRNERIPEALDAVVGKALRIDRAERYPSAAAMRAALAEVRTALGAPARPKLPDAVTVSVPPPSAGDRTPGAITSTVAGGGPWASGAAAAVEEKRALQEATTAPAAGPKRSPALMIAALAATAIVLFFVTNAALKRSDPPAPPPPAAAAAVAPAASSAPVVEAVSAPVPAVSSAPVVVASSLPVAVAPAKPAPPKCAQTEVVSNGHCCARGLEWQNGHCERPIATTF